MIVKTKCMFLGYRVGQTKEGKEYKQIKLLDKGTNDTLTLYVNELGKFEKLAPYTDNIEVDLNFYKDVKGLWRVGVVNA